MADPWDSYVEAHGKVPLRPSDLVTFSRTRSTMKNISHWEAQEILQSHQRQNPRMKSYSHSNPPPKPPPPQRAASSAVPVTNGLPPLPPHLVVKKKQPNLPTNLGSGPPYGSSSRGSVSGASPYSEGDSVLLTKDREGVVRFAGKVHFSKGKWFGIELIEGCVGVHNGTVGGKEYFTTDNNRGIFVKAHTIRRKITAKDLASPRRLDRRLSLEQRRKNMPPETSSSVPPPAPGDSQVKGPPPVPAHILQAAQHLKTNSIGSGINRVNASTNYPKKKKGKGNKSIPTSISITHATSLRGCESDSDDEKDIFSHSKGSQSVTVQRFRAGSSADAMSKRISPNVSPRAAFQAMDNNNPILPASFAQRRRGTTTAAKRTNLKPGPHMIRAVTPPPVIVEDTSNQPTFANLKGQDDSEIVTPRGRKKQNKDVHRRSRSQSAVGDQLRSRSQSTPSKSRLSRLFKRGDKKKQQMQVSSPIAVEHVFHATFDPKSGKFSGLPVEWMEVMNKQFGVPPGMVPCASMELYEADIPIVLILLKEALFNHDGYLEEGIFRVAPSTTECQEVKERINGGGFSHIDWKIIQPHILSTLIKQWYRDLPIQILAPIRLEVIENTNTIEDFAAVLPDIPQPNRDIFLWLLDLCGEVCKWQEKNKMTERNMAVVVSPNLLDPTTISNPMRAMTISAKLVDFTKIGIDCRRQEKMNRLKGIFSK